MKPIWKDGKLTVDLHKPEIELLKRARVVGLSLVAMHQDHGQELADVITAILGDGEDIVRIETDTE